MSNQFIGARQTTIAREIEVTGTGVHSGAPVSVTLHPAAADTGLRFFVTKRGRVVAEIAATVDNVKNLTLCTVLGNDAGITVSTVEHLLSALRGLAVDNCVMEIDSKEVPIMDGSSAPFVELIDAAGLRELAAPRQATSRCCGRCASRKARAGVSFLPTQVSISTSRSTSPPADRQAAPLLRDEPGRVPQRDLPGPHLRLHERRRAAVEGRSGARCQPQQHHRHRRNKIMNREGLRYPQEFVRHKMLDAVGDLALAGKPLLAAYRSVKGGHRLNSLVCRRCSPTRSLDRSCRRPRVRETSAGRPPASPSPPASNSLRLRSDCARPSARCVSGSRLAARLSVAEALP